MMPGLAGAAPPARRPSRLRCAGLATAAGITLVSLLVTVPARALTPEEIDAGSRRATAGLRAVTSRLAANGLEGRNNDTSGSVKAQEYLIRKLKRIGPGLDAGQPGDDAYRQSFVQSGKHGTNLLAVVVGRELPDEVVMIGAHYDHLGACDSSPGGTVCNGATDNATGVAAVIAIGNALRRLPEPPRRSVALALWDAEEDGLLGSLYYVNNPVVPLAKTVAYVNFDILGSDLLPSLRAASFAVGAETGGAALQQLVRDAVAAEGLATRLVSYVFGQLRSDYANFVAHAVPTAFFSDSIGGCYHTTGDDLRWVDWKKVRLQSKIAFRLAATLAESTAPPSFAPPNPVLATYDDAVAIAEVVHIGRADLALFPPAGQALLTAVDATLQQMVADGAAAFDAADASALLGAALSTIDLLTSLACPLPRS